jgi:DNA-binding LacI/PurR family transcriptional regulator
MVNILDRALEQKVDAVLVAGVHYPLEDAEAAIRWMRPGRPPLVYVTWHALSPVLPHVYYDNVAAGHAAGRHLLEVGYRRLAYLHVEDTTWQQERLEGVQRAAHPGHVLKLGPGKIRPAGANWQPEGLAARRRIARELVASLFDRPDVLRWAESGELGIVTCNDVAGCTVLEFLADEQFEPGRRVGVVGFDDTSAAQAHGLSSVRPPLEELADNAVRIAVQALNGGHGPLQVCCRSQVIARCSSQRHVE